MPAPKSSVFVTRGCLDKLAKQLPTLVLAVCLIASTPLAARAQAPRSPTPASVTGVVRVQTVAKGFEHPWSLAFLPHKRMLVTERPGRLRLVEQDGRVSEPLSGVPRVYASGQGGLLDVALSPAFVEDGLVCLSFCDLGVRGAGIAVVRGVLVTKGRV